MPRFLASASVFILGILFFSFSHASVDQSWIRIRIFENLKSVSISGSQIEVVQRADSFRNVRGPLGGAQKLNVEFRRKWNQSFLFTQQGEQLPALKPQSIFVKGEGLSVGSQSVTDFLQIYKRSSGFDIIAYVKFRDYLKGVVSSEMPANWPTETLKAQIIAARSYALFMKEKRKSWTFDVESSIKDQVYRHTEEPQLEPLMDETKDIVLFDERKNVLKAYYHSECGGQTSSAKKVFGESQGDVEVRDPYCAGRGWKLSISKDEIEKYLGPFKKIVNAFNPVKRAYAVGIERGQNQIENWDAQKLRMKIGSTRMKSTWFEARQNGSKIEFVGKGYGHGVGLCQWGSRQMGVMKKNFREILAFYYPQAMLKQITSGRLNF